MLAWVKQNGLPQNPLKKDILFVTEYESFSSRYRVSHFREHLSVIGICSDLVALKKFRLSRVKKYDVISFYRCSDTKSLPPFLSRRKNMVSGCFMIWMILFMIMIKYSIWSF